MILRVGLVQTRTPATHAEALAHVAPLVRQAAEDGARLIVTPEGTNILQKDREKLLPALTSAEDDPVVTDLRALARELAIWLDIGSALVRREDGKAANRQLLIAPDGAIEPSLIKLFADEVAKGIDELENLGLPTVIVSSNRVRHTLSRIARRVRPQAIVIGMGELPSNAKLSFQRVLCSAASN